MLEDIGLLMSPALELLTTYSNSDFLRRALIKFKLEFIGEN